MLDWDLIANDAQRTGIAAGVALEFRPPVTAAQLCNKDKYLELMFGDVGHARTKAAMLLLPIDTTSSPTCTKPTVMCIALVTRRL